jgi:hypothetical protein
MFRNLFFVGKSLLEKVCHWMPLLVVFLQLREDRTKSKFGRIRFHSDPEPRVEMAQ